MPPISAAAGIWMTYIKLWIKAVAWVVGLMFLDREYISMYMGTYKNISYMDAKTNNASLGTLGTWHNDVCLIFPSGLEAFTSWLSYSSPPLLLSSSPPSFFGHLSHSPPSFSAIYILLSSPWREAGKVCYYFLECISQRGFKHSCKLSQYLHRCILRKGSTDNTQFQFLLADDYQLNQGCTLISLQAVFKSRSLSTPLATSSLLFIWVWR